MFPLEHSAILLTCVKGSILQYFWPALSDNWYGKPILVFLRVTVLDCDFYLYRPWSRFPNYIDGDERCAYMEYSGEYVNRKCNILGGYICEKLSLGFAGKMSKQVSISKKCNIHRPAHGTSRKRLRTLTAAQ